MLKSIVAYRINATFLVHRLSKMSGSLLLSGYGKESIFVYTGRYEIHDPAISSNTLTHLMLLGYLYPLGLRSDVSRICERAADLCMSSPSLMPIPLPLPLHFLALLSLISLSPFPGPYLRGVYGFKPPARNSGKKIFITRKFAILLTCSY
jgi:hypothetical protein